jgi:hypothetical protein
MFTNLFCAEGEVEMQVQLTADNYSHETQVLVFVGQSLNDIAGMATAKCIWVGNFLTSGRRVEQIQPKLKIF